MSYFRIFKDKKDQYRWTLRATNGEPIATPGESFTRKASAEANIELVQRLAPKAPIHDRTKPDTDGHHGKGGTPEFEVYSDKAGEYRWRLQSGNNKIIAISSEGYKEKASCIEGIKLVKELAPIAKVKDETGGGDGGSAKPAKRTGSRGGRFG